MKTYLFVGLIVVLGLVWLAGCDESDPATWGISPVPTATPDVEQIESSFADWLRDYQSRGSLW